MRMLVLSFLAFFLSAAVEITTDCGDLEYSEGDEDNCEAYIICPSDAGYKVCTKRKSEYTLSACPNGAECEREPRYRLEDCKDGYTLSADGESCEKSCTPKNCSAYTLASCDPKGTCSSCSPGCGNNILTYKLDDCTSGYEFSADGKSCSKILTCDEAIAAAGGVRLTSNMSLESNKEYYMTENNTKSIGIIENVKVYDAAAVFKECANDPTVTPNPKLGGFGTQATSIKNTHFYVPVQIKNFSTPSDEEVSIIAHNNLWISYINREGGNGVGETFITLKDNPYYDSPLRFKARVGFICEKTSSYSNSDCNVYLENLSDNGYIEYCDYSYAYNNAHGVDEQINSNIISGDGEDVGCEWPEWYNSDIWYDGP